MAGAFLVLGWWPFAPAPRNRVEWLPHRPGLGFRPPGAAALVAPLLPAGAATPTEFTLEILLAPGGAPRPILQHILAVDQGGLQPAFAICQWRGELLLRVPDRTNPRGFREVAVAVLQRPPRVLAIAGGPSGTEVYVDGRLERRFPRFAVPADVWRGRVILGDAPAGKQSWTGEMAGLAFVHAAFDAERAARRYRSWLARDAVALGGDSQVRALFLLDEGRGDRAKDRMDSARWIEIPSLYRVAQRQAFTWARDFRSFWQTERTDAAVNLFGFVPFGYLVCHYWRRRFDGTRGRAALAGLAIGALLSLTIETGQIWLPTRVSSLTDLLFNSAGSAIGAWLAIGLTNRPGPGPRQRATQA